MTNRKLIICAPLFYGFQLGASASSASRKLRTAFGEGAVSERTARNWFQKFRSGNGTLEDEPRAGRPISLNNDNLKAAIESDLSLTCHKLASRFHVSDETIRLHLHQLGKRWNISSWVPYELTPAKAYHMLKKQPALVNRRQVLFFQDNARPHVAKMTLAKIAELNWEIMLHPPYSPDLFPRDFLLFLSLDNHIKNRTFNIEDHLKMEVHNFFQSRTKGFYQNGIPKLLNRWEKAIECEGSYFDE